MATQQMPVFSSVRERLGELIGGLWAPVVAKLSHARAARMFHPEGHTFWGVSQPVCGFDDEYWPLAVRLSGRVLARFSGALSRNEREYLDVLGLALRFRRSSGVPIDHRAEPGDTDLLTATIRSPLTMLASPLFTNARDFVGNRYWAVSPFAPALIDHRIELRLTPIDPPKLSGRRVAKLAAAVEVGRAEWCLEARRTLHLRWRPVCRITLGEPAPIDQAALRFDPFRGVLEPVGLVHAIRRATYLASQRARPGRELASP
jgi:hypothetical protein